MGTGEYLLPVFQDFFLETDLPLYLAQGDEINLPAAVYNYLLTPQEVKITLQTGQEYNWFDAMGEREHNYIAQTQRSRGSIF